MAEVEQVMAYKVWAIYADYDGEAPDTCDLARCASEEIADKRCEELNALDSDETGHLSFVDGCESCKVFKSRPVLVESLEGVSMSLEALREATLDEDYEDEDYGEED
jgi:hypothetical protein